MWLLDANMEVHLAALLGELGIPRDAPANGTASPIQPVPGRVTAGHDRLYSVVLLAAALATSTANT
jgi:hypothetical protein